MRRICPLRAMVCFCDILSVGGMPTYRFSGLVLTCGTRPLMRTFISLQGYRGEGWIFPCSQKFQIVVQQGVSQCTPRDTLEQMYCLLQIFQVARGQLCIGAFGSEEVQCLSLLIFTISHNISDGQCISCSLLYYVYSLVQELLATYNIFHRKRWLRPFEPSKNKFHG